MQLQIVHTKEKASALRSQGFQEVYFGSPGAPGYFHLTSIGDWSSDYKQRVISAEALDGQCERCGIPAPTHLQAVEKVAYGYIGSDNRHVPRSTYRAYLLGGGF